MCNNFIYPVSIKLIELSSSHDVGVTQYYILYRINTQ